MNKNILGLLFLLPTSAMAEPTSIYNLSLSGGSYEKDHSNNNTTRFLLSANYLINQNVFSTVEVDYFEDSEDTVKYFLGLGYQKVVLSNSSAYVSLSYGMRERVGEYDESVNGFKLNAGYVSAFNNNLDMFLEADFEKFDKTYENDNNELETLISAGVNYKFSKNFASNFSVNNKGVILGVMYNF